MAVQQTTGAAGRNVLAALDERTPASFCWWLTLLATLGGGRYLGPAGAVAGPRYVPWDS